MTGSRGYLALSKHSSQELHRSLVLTARPIGAVTFDTRSVFRQIAFRFDMAMYGRHKDPSSKVGTQNSRRTAGISWKGEHLRDGDTGPLQRIHTRFRAFRVNFQQKAWLVDDWAHRRDSAFDAEGKLRQNRNVCYAAKLATEILRRVRQVWGAIQNTWGKRESRVHPIDFM